MTLVVRSTLGVAAVERLVRDAARAVDPAAPVYGVAALEQRIADTLARRRLSLTLFALFAACALALAAIGIFGVVSYEVARQTRALGVRRALGADDRRVFAWVLGRSAAYAVIGLALGVPLALVWTRILASELVGVSPRDGASFAVVGAVLVGVVFLASLSPARRALRIAPTVALREE
jgi:ABC-type antimicrobial peptide transport system permease subunit